MSPGIKRVLASTQNGRAATVSSLHKEDRAMANHEEENKAKSSRRNFLKQSSVALVGGAVASRFTGLPAVHAAGSDLIKVGLIGCGGRGTGAAKDVLSSARGVKLETSLAAHVPRPPQRSEEHTSELQSPWN